MSDANLSDPELPDDEPEPESELEGLLKLPEEEGGFRPMDEY